MKRRDLIKELGKIAEDAGVEFGSIRSTGRHEVFTLGGLRVPIPRHGEINDNLARAILKDAARHVASEER